MVGARLVCAGAIADAYERCEDRHRSVDAVHANVNLLAGEPAVDTLLEAARKATRSTQLSRHQVDSSNDARKRPTHDERALFPPANIAVHDSGDIAGQVATNPSDAVFHMRPPVL